MVQNAGFVLKSRQRGRRERLETVAIYLLLAPKNLLFDGYFALISHVVHGSKRFCLYHCGVFLCFLSCI